VSTVARAAVLTTIGASSPYAASSPLSVEELELREPGPGEVLVRVGAAGICHSDLSVVDGVRPRPVPMVLGHEAAGVVEAVGAGVTHVRPGEHVVFSFVPACGDCVPCLSGRPALCERGAAANTAGTLLSGDRPFTRSDGTAVNHHLGVSAFAERTVAAAASVVPVDDALPWEHAALFGCALLTGVGAVLNTARVEPGSTAVVVGLGGVGLAAVMGARLAGCRRVVAVDLDPGKFDLARGVGATDVVRSGDDAVAQVRELTTGGADYAFEAAGHPDALALAYAVTGRGGTTVGIGLPHPDQSFALPALSLVAEERRLVGSYMGSAVPRRDIPRYVALFREGRMPVDRLAGASFPLERVNDAMDALAGGAVARQLLSMS
jgi:alcohol dehydrogenase